MRRGAEETVPSRRRGRLRGIAPVLLALLVLVLLFAVSFACAGVGARSAHGPEEQTLGLTRNPTVARLVAGVQPHESELRLTLKRLTGVVAAPVGGERVLISTRYALSGASVIAAQQYVCERLRAFGLREVRYQTFGSAAEDRNVIGEIRGTKHPDEIVAVGTHLDDKPETGPAPGADDNACSCAGLLYIAKRFAGRRFDRTVRFVFFGSEEIGVRGARYSGQISRLDDEDIVAMLNADMIGWDSDGSGIVEVHRRALDGTAETRGDLSIASTFVAVTHVPYLRNPTAGDGGQLGLERPPRLLEGRLQRGLRRRARSLGRRPGVAHEQRHDESAELGLLPLEHGGRARHQRSSRAHPDAGAESEVAGAERDGAGAAVVGPGARARDRCGSPSRLTRSPGGRGGIRTHEGLAPFPVFQTCRMRP
jgi:hypothetical protein